MSATLALLIALGVLTAGIVALVAIRAFADVRIAAHTGVDPRADRAVAKAAQVRQGQAARIGSGEVVDKIEQYGNLDRGGPMD